MWMDSRWGSSGRRIMFTIGKRFGTKSDDGVVLDEQVRQRMVRDYFDGTCSNIILLQSAG